MKDLTERELELIEKHLLNQLTQVEGQDFQKMMENEAFRKEVPAMRHFMVVMEVQGNAQLKALLATEEKKMTGAKKKALSPLRVVSRRWKALAAAVVLFIFTAWLIQSYFLLPSDLYAEFFEPYPYILQMPERGVGTAPLEAQAINAYEARDFQGALNAFDSLPTSDIPSDLLFYRANALLALGKISEAVPLLEEIAAEPGHLFYEHARWYLSLAVLKQGKTDIAKKALTKIAAEPDSPFQNRAKQLLEVMD